MIDIRHLIDFLPWYYKDKDTYKVNDKGILERFLEICGDYFTDNIKSVIDNTLDIYDLETTSQEYLAWIWELLGQIPFAQKPSVKPLQLTEAQQRDLIKYSNELLKIRGTKEFFELMFRIYSNSTNQLKLVSIQAEDFGWEKDLITSKTNISPYFDSDNFDDQTIKLDEYYRMKQCIDVTFTITGSFGTASESASKAIKAFIDRFVPYNVNAIVNVNGKVVTDTYKLVLDIYEDGAWITPSGTQALAIGQLLKVRVYLVNTSKATQEIVDGMEFTSKLNSGTAITRTSMYEFTISSVFGTEDAYNFTFDGPVANPADRTVQLKVKAEAEVSKTYTMLIDKSTYQLSPTNKEVTVKVTSFYTIDNVRTATSVMCVETGEVKTPTSGYVTEWTFDKPNRYTFIMIGHTSTQVTCEVKGFTKHYIVTLAKARYDYDKRAYVADGDYSNNLVLSGTNVSYLKFLVNVTCNDVEVSDSKLYCYIKGNPSTKYKSGACITPLGFDTYTFVPIEEAEGNENATLTVTSGTIIFLTSVIAQEKKPSVIEKGQTDTWADIKAMPQTDAANQLVSKGLTMVVELPNGTQVELTKGQTKSGQGYSITQSTSNTIRIVSSQSGVYTAWAKVYPSSKAIWQVTDNRHSERIPSGVMISPSGEAGWTGGNTAHAIYQLSEENLEARYMITGFIRNEDGTISSIDISGAEITASDGKLYQAGKIYTETEAKKITFQVKYTDPSGKVHNWSCSVQVKDYSSVVELYCTPSVALINNGQATTKLSITSNKSSDVLKIKLKSTGDLYNDGDTFLANEPGDYEFIAMVNGSAAKDADGNDIKAVFKVTDPSSVTVTPESLEFNADGTPVKGDTLQITTGDNTEWVLVLS